MQVPLNGFIGTAGRFWEISQNILLLRLTSLYYFYACLVPINRDNLSSPSTATVATIAATIAASPA
jgi:hypothetical protein